MPRLTRLVLIVLAASALAVAFVACGDDDDSDGETKFGVQSLPDSSCTEVEFGGEGDADVLIASDLPKQGDSAERTEQMNDGIRQVLEREEWKAGETNVAFQACDDSIEETGEWDEAKCQENAKAYAENPDVVGVIGTYNSGCAAEIIPILNEAPDGGVVMVSPGNTLVCLTEPAPSCEPDQPDVFYPTKTRNYARVVPNDAFQMAGLAQFAFQNQVRSPFVVYAPDAVTKGQGEAFRNAAEFLNMKVAGFEQWDPKAADYTQLMNKVRASGADALLLAGLLEDNGAQLIKDKVAVLGPNQGDQAAVQLLAADGFAQQATIDDAGQAALGMYASIPGRAPSTLTGPGKQFVDQLTADLDGAEVELFAPYAGQAAEVLIGGISASRERATLTKNLTKLQIENGIIGNFSITPTGDPSLGPISVLVAAETFKPEAQVESPPEFVEAARTGQLPNGPGG